MVVQTNGDSFVAGSFKTETNLPLSNDTIPLTSINNNTTAQRLAMTLSPFQPFVVYDNEIGRMFYSPLSGTFVQLLETADISLFGTAPAAAVFEIDANSTQVSTGGLTTEVVLHSFTVPANTVAADNFSLSGVYAGTFSTAAGDVDIRLYINNNLAVEITATGAIPGFYQIGFDAIRNSNALRAAAKAATGVNGGSVSATLLNQNIITNFASTFNIELRAQASVGGASATCNQSKINAIKAP